MEFEARAEKAKAWYKRTPKEDRDPRIEKGLELAGRKAFKEAIALLDKVVAERPQSAAATGTRSRIIDLSLWDMVDSGFATWSGGKPKGSRHPVRVTPGPPISDYVHEMRH